MAQAICIACGHAKSAPWRRCRSCGLEPTNDDITMVKSVYLSTGRFDQAEEKECYEKELDAVGQRIGAGESYCYDEAELARLLSQKRLVEKIPARAVWAAIGRLLLPGVLLVIVLVIVMLVLRSLR